MIEGETERKIILAPTLPQTRAHVRPLDSLRPDVRIMCPQHEPRVLRVSIDEICDVAGHVFVANCLVDKDLVGEPDLLHMPARERPRGFAGPSRPALLFRIESRRERVESGAHFILRPCLRALRLEEARE